MALFQTDLVKNVMFHPEINEDFKHTKENYR